jgi:hypothetical protein
VSHCSEAIASVVRPGSQSVLVGCWYLGAVPARAGLLAFTDTGEKRDPQFDYMESFGTTPPPVARPSRDVVLADIRKTFIGPTHSRTMSKVSPCTLGV